MFVFVNTNGLFVGLELMQISYFLVLLLLNRSSLSACSQSRSMQTEWSRLKLLSSCNLFALQLDHNNNNHNSNQKKKKENYYSDDHEDSSNNNYDNNNDYDNYYADKDPLTCPF